jgi:hypothetical protein
MEAFEGNNTGGIRRIFVIGEKYINYPRFKKQVSFDEISIETGKNFEEIKFSLESANFGDIEKEENGNTYFEKSAGLTIPKLRSEVKEFLAPYKGIRLAILLQDNNSSWWLLHPVRMSTAGNIPAAVAGLNALRSEFFGKGIYEAPEITGIDDASPLV